MKQELLPVYQNIKIKMRDENKFVPESYICLHVYWRLKKKVKVCGPTNSK